MSHPQQTYTTMRPNRDLSDPNADRDAMANTVADDKPTSRFLSQEECVALAKRAAGMSVGGGDLAAYITTSWTGNVRYARNQIISTGDVRDNWFVVERNILGAKAEVLCNQISDTGIEAALRRAERMLRNHALTGGAQFREHFQMLDSTGIHNQGDPEKSTISSDVLSKLMQTMEPFSKPKLFFDPTYNLEAPERLREVQPLIEAVKQEKLVAAGYIEATASGRVVMDTWGRTLYYPYTESQFSVTVRDPEGTGSGWAGVDFGDWSRIDAKKLTQVAMEKCIKSRNPVAVEPGRYTAVLEPQAVSDVFSPIMSFLDREWAEQGGSPFSDSPGYSKIGLKILDERITVSADPMDPDIGFPPFDGRGAVYNPVNWVENGTLKELDYDRRYGITSLGINKGLPNSGAYRMSGGTATVDEMVASTKRGLLVTRFSNVGVVDKHSILLSGYTRDGLWLIENGKISKPVKNFRFLESPLFIFNNLETLGVPTKVFRPGRPTVVPSAKVRDFSFTSLIDAV